ncbi:MAG: phosphoglycerate kinase [Candidatus Faecenecus gallistercoris]|nr:phosphoglycerate kinase [Bacillota bacterium]MDD7102776.1 phosphoglycerate kinase [Bacillota bacterium]MDY4051660.1 phosphoglycerate kinase [Candidatus Faecenecus gallistercoris]
MKKTIKDYDLHGKRVIIRCDFNVPMKDGKITDDTRIQAALPTIEYTINESAKVILMSHLGRVKEEKDLVKNDLFPVAQRLSNLLNQKVLFCKATSGSELKDAVDGLKDGEVLLMQNTRYEDLNGKKESSNDPELGAFWASLGDIYINDAFGTAHRAHASNVGIASHLPNGIGFLIEKELNHLESLKNPERPYVIIMGGAKVSDKIKVIENLAPIADKIMIGGGMAFTFLKAKGIDIGKSLLEEDSLEFCQKMIATYGDKLVLPVDVNVTTEFSEETPHHICKVSEIGADEMAMDIGPETIAMMKEVLANAKTVFWNGPLGVYEMKEYQKGTNELLKTIANSSIHSVLGGGDIVAAASELGFKDKVSHASTGGGATLEFLEGKELPGIAIIQEK